MYDLTYIIQWPETGTYIYDLLVFHFHTVFFLHMQDYATHTHIFSFIAAWDILLLCRSPYFPLCIRQGGGAVYHHT